MSELKLYPLTHPQKRIWYIEKIYPFTSAHNIGGFIRIKGAIDFNILEQSFNIFIRQNDGIRLRITEAQGEPMQYIAPYSPNRLDILDFSKEDNPDEAFRKWADQEARRPFDLTEQPLYYIALYKINDECTGYFVKFHHIIFDGWSVALLTAQVAENYERLKKGEEIDEKVQRSYFSYLEEEQNYLQSERFLRNKEYWNEKFESLPEISKTQSSDNIAGNRKVYLLDEKRTQAVRSFIQKNKYSLNTFFAAFFLIYLYKINQDEDIVIGVPVLNRSGAEDRNTVGMFTSTMPFRIAIEDDASVTAFLKRVNSELKRCYINQKYPYNLLAQDLKLRQKGYKTLFTKYVNYYNTKHVTQIDGFGVENEEFYNGNQMYSMQLVIKEWLDQDNIILHLDYKMADYSDEEVDTIYKFIINLVDQALENPEAPVAELDLLSEDERQRILYGFNKTQSSYPNDMTVISLFQEQARRAPEKIALQHQNISLTYKELDEKSSRLAGYLAHKNIAEGSIVGIMADHSPELIVGILGILKSGAAYLPLDFNYPEERIKCILEDAKADYVLTHLPGDISFKASCEFIDLKDSRIYDKPFDDRGQALRQDGAAYVIYTSGSTGKPKGVIIQHKSLLNYILWAEKVYGSDENDVYAFYSSISFDLTITSIFTPLIGGAKLKVYSPDEDEYVLYKIMQDNEATVIKLTPSHLMLLRNSDNRNASVKRFIIGGEDLKVSLAQDIFKSFGGNIALYNEYGPTEATVGCMIHKYDPQKDTDMSVPIGIPADNMQIYILDKNLRPLPTDTAGEIYISGDGIARGYLNNEDLTNQKFIENPFIPGKKMYKTGDLGKFNKEGLVVYIGRCDDQVKIRGHRIELGEIEKQLMCHGSIKNAVVLSLNEGDSNYLCAYLLTDKELHEDEIKSHLSAVLPEYMIPSHYIVPEDFPLTVNGKINKALLPKPDRAAGQSSHLSLPSNEKEEALILVMKDIFEVSNISTGDNFYHLGGDSIKAIQISSELNILGYKIKVRDILANPLIYEMASCMTKEGQTLSKQMPCTGQVPLSPIISWFFSQNFKNPNFYNQSVLLKLNEAADVETIENIIHTIIKQHDALRMNYDSINNILFYNPKHLDEALDIEVYDLSGCHPSEQQEKIKTLGYALKSSLDLEVGLLLKCAVFKLSENENYMLLTAHHLVIDGISWRVIVEDFSALLAQSKSGESLRLPPKTASFQTWSSNLQTRYKEIRKEERAYWKSVLDNQSKIPTDFDLGEDTLSRCKTAVGEITQEETQQLLTYANRPFKTTTEELLMTALCTTMARLFKIKDMVIELEGHGRQEIFNDINISRTIGWFTAMYPINIKNVEVKAEDNIKAIKEQLRSTPDKGMGYGVLKYLRAELPEPMEKTVRFNYLGDLDGSFKNSSFEFSEADTGHDTDEANPMTCLLDINLMVINKKLKINMTYSMNKFKDETMTHLLGEYINTIKQLIHYCTAKKGIEFTPSDFDTLRLSQREIDSLFI